MTGSGGELVARCLAAHGVDTVFGIPGTHSLEIYRGLARGRIRHVTTRHEQGAGYAADGFARATGRPGVAVVTTGPAVLNIATAVAQAYSDSIPILVVSPGMPLAHPGRGNGTLHELRDQSGVMAAIAGRSHRVRSVEEIPAAVAQAFAELATDRPRPIHLEIPYDLLAAPAPDLPIPVAPTVPPRGPDPVLIERAATLLAGAQRIALIVGGGARRAADAVTALAERLGAAVFATANGKGTVPDDHPLFVTAALHRPAVGAALDGCDAILALGTELAATDFWYGPPAALGRGTGLIRVDVDPAQLHINARPEVAIVGDCGLSVAELLPRLPSRAAPPVPPNAADGPWRPWLAALDEVLRPLGRNALVAADTAMACYYGALGDLPVRRPGGFCYPTGFGTLGYAVPAAIGATVGDPAARVVALCGDGGLMFSVAEIATAASAGICLPVVVFANGGYGEIRAEMAEAGIEPLGVALPEPDFVGLAAALGGVGVAVADPAALTRELAAALDRGGPTLLVVRET